MRCIMRFFKVLIVFVAVMFLIGTIIYSLGVWENERQSKHPVTHELSEEEEEKEIEEQEKEFEEQRIIKEAKEDAVDWTEARSLVGVNTCIKGKVISQDDDCEDGVYLYIGNNASSSSRFQVFVPDDCLYRFADNNCDYYLCSIAVYGKVELANGVPQITVRHPDDIVILW